MRGKAEGSQSLLVPRERLLRHFQARDPAVGWPRPDQRRPVGSRGIHQKIRGASMLFISEFILSVYLKYLYLEFQKVPVSKMQHPSKDWTLASWTIQWIKHLMAPRNRIVPPSRMCCNAPAEPGHCNEWLTQAFGLLSACAATCLPWLTPVLANRPSSGVATNVF